MEGSAHYEGRAVDVFFRPINEEQRKRGWAMAYYLVAQADRLDIPTVIYDDMIWTARRSDDGCPDFDPGALAGTPAATVAIHDPPNPVHATSPHPPPRATRLPPPPT